MALPEPITGGDIREQELILALGVRAVWRRDDTGVWFFWGWRMPACYA